MKQVIPWVLSAVTLFGMWLLGNKNKWGWAVGLANQALWITFIVWFAAWGLMALAVALIVVYTRNLIRWHRQENTGVITSVTSSSATFLQNDVGKRIRIDP